MEKTLSKANEIESQVYTQMSNAMDLLDHIHSYGDESLDRKKLWEIRARMQDALRAMNDLQGLRKNLPYVEMD